jgi:DNA-binding LacI/PurR family transcriptional regulator
MTPISITDIAKAAGVAPSTVSRALQDHPRISPRTRAAVRALAQQMGYQPSQVARSLVTGRTKTLGVVITDVTDPFVAEVLKGAEQAARELGYSLLFATSRRDPDQELLAAQLLLARQVDGMIVISSRAAELYTTLLTSNGAPLVLVNHDVDNEQAHSVRTNNGDGIRQALTHLRELGHSRVAFIAGPDGGRSSSERLQAYREACVSFGMPDASHWVVPGKGLLEDGQRAFMTFVKWPQPPSAVLCYNDLTAIGLMAAAHAAGVRVPDDLSVVGYDNIPLSAFTIPRLTTVDQPKEALGRVAVQSCVSALSGGNVDNVILPGKLVIRQSTSGPSSDPCAFQAFTIGRPSLSG